MPDETCNMTCNMLRRLNALLHICMSHGKYMYESWHTYARVMAHICTSHVTHMHESCHTYAWVMSHICMSHVTHMHESCHTYAWVMSHICMSHVTHMHEFWYTHKWVMSHSHSHTNESCHTGIDIRMSHVTNESCHEWHVNMCDNHRYPVAHDMCHTSWCVYIYFNAPEDMNMFIHA